MRKLRPRLLFPLTCFAALAFWVACGDDDNDANIVEPVVDSGVQTNLPDVATSQPDVVTTPPSGPDRDGGTLVTLDAGPGVDGGIPCYAGGELEVEPNDLLSQANEMPEGAISANVLKRILCGITANGDGGLPDAGDFESLRFTLGDASTDFFLRFEGNVTVTIETDGAAPVDISQPNIVLPREYNQPYFVRVNAKDGKTQKWKIVLFEDQADAGR